MTAVPGVGPGKRLGGVWVEAGRRLGGSWEGAEGRWGEGREEAGRGQGGGREEAGLCLASMPPPHVGAGMGVSYRLHCGI